MKLFNKNHDPQKIEVSVSNETIIRVLLMVILLILVLGLLRLMSGALLLIFTSFFLALALNAPVHWISQNLPGKRRGSRVMGTSISYLVVVGVLVLFLSLLLPPAIQQTSQFFSNAPRLAQDLQDQNSAIGTFVQDYNLEGLIEGMSEELSTFARNSGGAALNTVSTIGTSVASVLAVLAITFMMLIEGPRWVNIGKRLLPLEQQDHGAKLAHDMYAVVKGFVNGQVTLAAIAALILLPVMLILGIPYAGALAAIVFVCGLIPMIGHIIGATIVTLVALFESPITAFLILSFYILYQQIENYAVQPRVQSSTTNISPLLVLVAVLIGVNINGIIGGIVAIPLMACLRIIIIDYLQRTGRLGLDETATRPSDQTAQNA